MKSLEMLKEEHRVIEEVLEALERMAQSAEKGSLDIDKARKALDILRNFADRCHHGKEEKQLFGLMEKRGIPRAGGPLAVMLQEHEQGRGHIGAMAESLEAAAHKDAGALQNFAAHAHGYVALLRAHIDKEDNILYAMAEKILTAADDEMLQEAFDKVEAEEMGAGTHEKYHAWVHELKEDK